MLEQMGFWPQNCKQTFFRNKLKVMTIFLLLNKNKMLSFFSVVVDAIVFFEFYNNKKPVQRYIYCAAVSLPCLALTGELIRCVVFSSFLFCFALLLCIRHIDGKSRHMFCCRAACFFFALPFQKFKETQILFAKLLLKWHSNASSSKNLRRKCCIHIEIEFIVKSKRFENVNRGFNFGRILKFEINRCV